MIYLISLMLMAATEDNAMKDLAEKTKIASLSTMYKEYPYASLVPYAIDAKGRPIICISDLAVHTKNLKKNSKCSIMAVKVNKDDVFNSSRITFVGKMVKVPEKELEAIKKLYLEKYPDSKDTIEFHDFSFYRMEVEHIQYIGGFGDINWYDKEDIEELWK